MNKVERGLKILVTVLIYCIFSVSLTAETKITFEIPLDIDYKTEKNESQVFQMFRFERHPDDPDYWGMDLPSFVVVELPADQYHTCTRDYRDGDFEAMEQEMETQLSRQSGICAPKVSLGILQIEGLSGFSMMTQFKILGTEVTNQIYSVWFQIQDTYWMGAGSSLRDQSDLARIEKILKTAKIHQ